MLQITARGRSARLTLPGGSIVAQCVGMTDSNGHPTTAHVKPKLSGIALGAIALSAAITVLVCYLFVRNTHRQGESFRPAPAELPDTVSPDRAHGTR